jgi:hypothetical protein
LHAAQPSQQSHPSHQSHPTHQSHIHTVTSEDLPEQLDADAMAVAMAEEEQDDEEAWLRGDAMASLGSWWARPVDGPAHAVRAQARALRRAATALRANGQRGAAWQDAVDAMLDLASECDGAALVRDRTGMRTVRSASGAVRRANESFGVVDATARVVAAARARGADVRAVEDGPHAMAREASAVAAIQQADRAVGGTGAEEGDDGFDGDGEGMGRVGEAGGAAAAAAAAAHVGEGVWGGDVGSKPSRGRSALLDAAVADALGTPAEAFILPPPPAGTKLR